MQVSELDVGWHCWKPQSNPCLLIKQHSKASQTLQRAFTNYRNNQVVSQEWIWSMGLVRFESQAVLLCKQKGESLLVGLLCHTHICEAAVSMCKTRFTLLTHMDQTLKRAREKLRQSQGLPCCGCVGVTPGCEPTMAVGTNRTRVQILPKMIPLPQQGSNSAAPQISFASSTASCTADKANSRHWQRGGRGEFPYKHHRLLSCDPKKTSAIKVTLAGLHSPFSLLRFPCFCLPEETQWSVF